jgi:hypothetical protein
MRGLKMRDTRKDKAYFEGYIEANHAQIQRFEDALRTIIDQSRSADKRVQTGFISLSVFYFNKLISMYSADYSLDDISAFIPDVIETLEKSWKPSVVRSYDYYIQCVWMLSIGHMLEIDEEQMDRLRRLGETYRNRDALIDFLLDGRVENKEFFLDEPYPELWDVMTGSEASDQVNQLKAYLENDWYEGHEEAGWHNTHHKEDYVYRGYWSFESGAIVKILGLDDSSLKDLPYYPYDMVHYRG